MGNAGQGQKETLKNAIGVRIILRRPTAFLLDLAGMVGMHVFTGMKQT
jgi:hypothetical protein